MGYHCISPSTVSKEHKNYYNLYKQRNHGQSSIYHIPTCLVCDKSNTTYPHIKLQLIMNPKANKSLCCYSYDIYRACIKRLKKCREWVPHTKTRKKVHFNIYPQTVFHAEPNSKLNSVLQIFTCATLKNAGIFSSNYKRRYTSTYFQFPSNHFQQAWDHCKVQGGRCERLTTLPPSWVTAM